MAQFVGKTSLNGTNHRIYRNQTAECVGSKNSESVSELKMDLFFFLHMYTKQCMPMLHTITCLE